MNSFGSELGPSALVRHETSTSSQGPVGDGPSIDKLITLITRIDDRLSNLEKNGGIGNNLPLDLATVVFDYYFNSTDLNLYERFRDSIGEERALALMLKILASDRNSKLAWIGRLEEHGILKTSNFPVIVKKKTRDSAQILYLFTEKGKEPIIDYDGSRFERICDDIISNSAIRAMNEPINRVIQQNEDDMANIASKNDKQRAMIEDRCEARLQNLLDSMKHSDEHIHSLLDKYRRLRANPTHLRSFISRFQEYKGPPLVLSGDKTSDSSSSSSEVNPSPSRLASNLTAISELNMILTPSPDLNLTPTKISNSPKRDQI
jgi:hypothetical protein